MTSSLCSHQTTNILNHLLCRIGTVTSSVFHLSLSLFFHILEMVSGHGHVLQVCTVEFLGEVHCTLHPLHKIQSVMADQAGTVTARSTGLWLYTSVPVYKDIL